MSDIPYVGHKDIGTYRHKPVHIYRGLKDINYASMYDIHT